MNINVSGSVAGIGVIGYSCNSSKRKAKNPILVINDESYSPGDCPIAAIEYKGFSPNKIININSKEEEVYENSIDYHKVETLIYDEDNSIYPIIHYPYDATYNDKLNYLVTDIKSESQNGKPLFYQYELLFDAASVVASGVTIKNIFRNNETVVAPSDYKVQYSYDLLSNGSGRYSSTDWTNPDTEANRHRVRVLFSYDFISSDSFYTIEYDKYVGGITQYQKELIELAPLYQDSDFSLNESGLSLSSSGNISSNASQLWFVKDPDMRITPLDIVSIKGDGHLSDKVAQWNLRLNLGSFFVGSGTYTNNSSAMYNLEDYYNTTNTPITNIKPINVNDTILKVNEVPIFVNPDTYTYPYYTIETYDKDNIALTDPSGKIAIDINGTTRTDIVIKSIDRNKGYIELDTSINPTDEVELSFYTASGSYILLQNLELNPKIPTSLVYGPSQNIRQFPSGIGLAVKAWDGTSSSYFPYIYNLGEDETSRTMYTVPSVGDTPTSIPWDDTFISICELELNRLTTDIVKLTDARITAGGIASYKVLDTWLSSIGSGLYQREPEWYTNKGYYGGTPLAHSSTIILHIPEDSINEMRQEWITYYTSELGDVTRAEIKGEKEFKYYLDQTIRKYISAGSDYILIPSVSGVLTGKILDLRQ